MSDHQVLAFVSGKGGVGKTMLCVAAANELSTTKKTLLFDLDFFNRGLSGLLASLEAHQTQQLIAPPDFIVEDKKQEQSSASSDEKWAISQIKRNLYTITYGDLDKAVFESLQALQLDTVVVQLRNYITALAAKHQFEFVILDCHGGPDTLSFAACTIANHSILVSEPDRITLHGTLNFLRSLALGSTPNEIDIHLVFNKVIPAFSSIFLYNFYDQLLRKEFHNNELLSVYPLEVYLTKSFEQVPFLTSAYPYSQLAVKTRLLLYNLFSTSNAKLAAEIARAGAIRRGFTKYYMGRWPIFFQLDAILKGVASCLIVLYAIYYFLGNVAIVWTLSALGLPRDAVVTFIFVLLCWATVGLILNLTRELDMKITYFLRTNVKFPAFAYSMLLLVLWFGVSALLGSAAGRTFVAGADAKAAVELGELGELGVGVLGTIAVMTLLVYADRGLRSLIHDRQYIEGGFRVLLVVGALLVACWSLVKNSAS